MDGASAHVMPSGHSPRYALLLAVCVLAGLSSCESRSYTYVAVGPFVGWVCSGVVIQHCGFVPIDAVKGKGDQMFEVRTDFSSVDEYNEKTGHCSVKTKSVGGGAVSWASNAMNQPDFQRRVGPNQYEKVDAEFVSFKCLRR